MHIHVHIPRPSNRHRLHRQSRHSTRSDSLPPQCCCRSFLCKDPMPAPSNLCVTCLLPKLPTLQNWVEAMPCFHLLSMWPRGAELPRIAEDLLHHTHHTSHKKHGPHGTCAPGMIQLPPDQCQRPQPQCSQSTLGAPMACAVRSSHHDPGLFGTVALHVKVKFGRVSSIHCTCSDCMSPGRRSTGRLRHTETWKQ